MIEKINKKYIIKSWNSNYIHNFILKEHIKELLKNWYEILWYDGIIINNEWTNWPLSLIFDFSRENYSINEKNNLAIKNIKELLKRTVKEWYNLNDLYVDIVYK